MKVTVAAKILSRTVATSIETFVSNQRSDAVDTAELIHLVDMLFDLLNSSDLTSIHGEDLYVPLLIFSTF